LRFGLQLVRILALADLASYLQELLDSDPILPDIWVEGEVSNFSRAASGHLYLTLKDGDAQLKAVCFRSYAARLAALPRNGDLVLAHGRVAFYAGGGQIQLYVDALRPAGLGLLHARFEELKQRLAVEGLFDPARKRALPALPRRIGVVTSGQGAAWRDILTVLGRRCPLVEVVLSPCLVQGEQAPDSIVDALYRLFELPGLDLIIVARGGGAVEDLWAFNEEVVARAVFASPVPVITGVGHETDTTIVDYVADLRAPTPSAAAELAAPDVALLADALAGLRDQLDITMNQQLEGAALEVDELARRLAARSPQARLDAQRQQIDAALQRASAHVAHRIALQRATVQGLAGRLAALDPQATLRRGYAIVTRDEDGQPVSEPGQVAPGVRVQVQTRGGTFGAVVDDQ
jgi:exodeoxyribonuclease VII large subunit